MTDYPLTSNQQLIWAEQQLHPDRVLYVVAQMVRFDGEIDPDRFERALCALVAATDALRFVVIEERGTPRQHAEPTLPVCLLHLDFSAAVDPDAALHAWAEAEMEQPFPRGLMFASALARLGRDRWAWFYRVHHLVFDGASATLLARRMSMLYEAAGDGEPPVPTYPRLEEYIASQTAYEATADAEVARQYWADRMNEPAERWRVCRPAGRPRGPGIVRSVQAIEADDLRRLDEVARLLHPGVANLDAARVNVLTALAAATAWRLIGPDVLPIGTLFGNRPHGAHAALVGFLSTTGVLRVDVGAGSSLGSLAAAIREQYVEARRHSRICARNAGPGAFDLLVNYFRWAPTMPFAGRTAELEMLTAGQAGCGAALQFKASADGRELLWHLDLNPHEFDDTARAGFIELFGRVLGSGLRSPEAPIASLARVAPSAGDNLLAGEVTAPAVAVIDAVLARACGAPSTTAVEQDGRRVTYAELRRNLERVAATLRAYGVAPGEVVAIAMPRGLEQVTAVLGVLRAGAACLPIDVQWPVERCRAVAVAAGARYAIAGHGNATTFAGVASIVDPGRMQAAPTTVDGEPPGSAATTSAGEPLNAAVTDSCAGQLKPAPARPDVAFVFATSGTTGAPRAV